MTTITPSIRFAAHAYVQTFAVRDRYMARRPSLVESFPSSYTPELIARAEDLLVRMATPIRDEATLAALRADLASFRDAVEAHHAGGAR